MANHKIILGLFLLFSFSSFSQITKDSIQVKKVQKHPFLSDHRKMLVVKNGTKTDSLKTYMDPGSGCQSSLFENDSSFIYIECNGNWINISKQNGEIHFLKWNWEKEIKDNYIGTFQRSKGDYYKIVIKENPKLYFFKDPSKPK